MPRTSSLTYTKHRLNALFHFRPPATTSVCRSTSSPQEASSSVPENSRFRGLGFVFKFVVEGGPKSGGTCHVNMPQSGSTTRKFSHSKALQMSKAFKAPDLVNQNSIYIYVGIYICIHIYIYTHIYICMVPPPPPSPFSPCLKSPSCTASKLGVQHSVFPRA